MLLIGWVIDRPGVLKLEKEGVDSKVTLPKLLSWNVLLVSIKLDFSCTKFEGVSFIVLRLEFCCQDERRE